MPDLIAQGPRPQDRWRRPLPEIGVVATLGRTSEPWTVGWDDRISRRHATIRWNGVKLEVSKIAESRNAIFYRGQQRDQFAAAIGEHFVIGQTTFTLLDQQVEFSAQAVPVFAEQTFSAHLLRQSKYRDADRRIEVLGKLPEIIAGSSSDEELCARIVNVLLLGISQASFVAILRVSSGTVELPSALDSVAERETRPASGSGAPSNVEILHWDCRSITGHKFAPSSNLVRSATETRESVLHVWNRSIEAGKSYTQSENVDWAFCTPVTSDACPGWAIYVAGDFATAGSFGPAGKGEEAEALQDDLKFAELTATTLGALRQVRALQRRQDGLRNFFAPVVLEALAGTDPDKVLAPRETNVSILFCDLRGFSKQSEDAADKLLELLQRVSDALGVMTHHILNSGGVVGDFHGDAAMGFWGWPIASEGAMQAACEAALAICDQFERAAAQPDHPLAGFRAGLGIASGAAVAGRIGTTDQVKVTVFGPVVNLASRLEAMTKQLQASILMDEPTADWIRKHVSKDILRVRRVAKVLPYGMQTPLVVSELLPPAGPASILTDDHIAAYEQALEHFLLGQWTDAFRLLHQVPAEDRVKDFLTVYIAQHRRTAPADWRGVIELPSK
ncbi:MAG: adenylate/guanylate cyclase domain-containing protein [Pirellulaceae bacterium]|nr:adenylate/guanylate cyclase domain-containing protein [Pirellulaceae bacterium]